MKRHVFPRKLLLLESLEQRLAPAWFLKIDSIPGESHQQAQIDGPSLKSGVLLTGPGAASIQWQPGKASVNDIAVSRSLANASLALYQACVGGTNIPSVTVNLRKADAAGGVAYLQLELKDVYISRFRLGTGGSDSDILLMESISMNFTRATFQYDAYAKGTLRQPVGNVDPLLKPDDRASMNRFLLGQDQQQGPANENKGPVKEVTRTQKNADGSTTTTVFDGKGNATKVIHEKKNPDGSTTVTESDGKGKVTKVTVTRKNKDGTTTTTEYDGKGNVTRVIQTRTSKDGKTVISEFDGKGKLVKKTEIVKNQDGSTTTTTTEWTAKGKVVTKTVTGKDKKGNTIIVVYVNGQLTKVTKIEKDKNGDTVTTELDGKGNVTKKTVVHKNEDGSTTTTEYDGKGKKTKITKVEYAKDGTKVTVEADGDGNVKKVIEEKTEADGSKTTTEYEGKGKLK